MAEHDYVIANQNGANTRSDLNNALAAIVSNNSKASAPTTTYAYMWWADTANDILKQRNGADSAWISILTLSTGAPLATIANFTSTGIDDNATSTAITIDSAEHVSLAHGIGFNGDTAAANALDDYEEGTWTPVLTRNTAPTIAYTLQQADYTKIGNMVTISMSLLITSVTAQGGSITFVSGLPFSNGGIAYSWVGSVGMNNGFASECHICQVSAGGTNITFHAADIGFANLQTDFTNGWIQCSLTYQTDS